MSRVAQIPIPARAGVLANLDRVDYADAFSVDVALHRRPEDWLRLTDSLSPAVMVVVRRVQQGLGLLLTPPAATDHPLGRTILHSTDDEGLLGADGPLVTRIVALTPPGKIVVATMLRYNRALARPLWAVVSPVHRAVARRLLERMSGAALQPAQP